MYNYRKALIEDIKEYIKENKDCLPTDAEALEEKLYDDLWVCDSVSGNGSGTYTFNREEAKSYVQDNMNLCVEALKDFCVSNTTIAEKFLDEDWEYFDVTIRCYLLDECITTALEELKEGIQ